MPVEAAARAPRKTTRLGDRKPLKMREPFQALEPTEPPHMPRQQKITFGEMRAFGARRIVVFCSNYRRRLDHPARRSLAGSCQAVGYRVAVRLKGLRQLSSSVPENSRC
jgi:hypothetical protein